MQDIVSLELKVPLTQVIRGLNVDYEHVLDAMASEAKEVAGRYSDPEDLEIARLLEECAREIREVVRRKKR